jgi:hypothetical protein
VPQPLAQWFASQFRCTAFVSEDSAPTAGTWKRLTGEEPQEVRAQPRLRAARESGVVLDAGGDNVELAVVHQPGRADLTVGLREKLELPQPPGEQFELIFAVRATPLLVRTDELVQKWLADVQHVKRLAFGANFKMIVSGRDEAWGVLRDYLPYLKELDTEHLSDFNLQLNRHRTYAGVRINRLRRWHMERASVTATASTGQQIPLGDAQELLALTLDFSTDAARTEDLPNPVEFWSELVQACRELVEQGDLK